VSQTKPAPPKPPKSRPVASAGYRKGDETRQRVLDVALAAFGDAGFAAMTTRRLADSAGVSLPVLQYYFGGKEGLYLACAEAIVDRYRSHTARAAGQAADALREDCSVEEARGELKNVIGALAGFLVGSKEAMGWAQFVARELRDPGPAFEILFERLWRPGVEITARLVARILGRPTEDEAARVQALLLISSLLAFQSGRSISMRTMQWAEIGREELALVLDRLNAMIDALGRS
jgi:AcrR family transcriptional regulator